MAEKTIRHAIFDYEVGESRKIAFHGQTVDIPNDNDIERGEREGAFFEVVGQETDRMGILQALSPEATLEQMKAYIVSGTTQEIVAQAASYPKSVAAMLADLESKRIGARHTLVDQLRSLADVPTQDQISDVTSQSIENSDNGQTVDIPNATDVEHAEQSSLAERQVLQGNEDDSSPEKHDGEHKGKGAKTPKG